MAARTQAIPLNENFHTLKERYFCTSGLSLEAVILPVDESPDYLERTKATGHSLRDLAGKVSLVFLCSVHPAWLRARAAITGGYNSTGSPVSDVVNTKCTSKDNILPARQSCLAFHGDLFS